MTFPPIGAFEGQWKQIGNEHCKINIDFKYLNWPEANHYAKMGSMANDLTLRQQRRKSVSSRVEGFNLEPADYKTSALIL